MRMLADLKDELDEIEAQDEWARKFIEDMLIRQETAEKRGEKLKVSDKQFLKLRELHERFAKR